MFPDEEEDIFIHVTLSDLSQKQPDEERCYLENVGSILKKCKYTNKLNI